MHNSKLLSLIKGLQANELHWLQKFLASPFYNSNEEYITLFQYIKKYYPDLLSPKLSKATAFQKLYPNESFNLQKLRKAMHGLALLVEEFLVAMHLRNQAFEKKKVLVAALGERNIYEQFQKGTQELISHLEAQSFRDANHYKTIHHLNLEYYRHVETSKQKQNKSTLKAAIDHLDYYYLLQRQQLDLTIQWHIKLLGEKIKTDSLEESRLTLRQVPVFRLYELIAEAETAAWSEKRYLKMETLFKKEIKQLALSDREEIIRILLNHLSIQINKGKPSYYAKVLTLYKFGLAQGLLLENGKMGETTFANIATVGITEKEFDWVENYIKEYREYLPESVQEDAYSLSLSLLYFHKKNYKRTIDLLLSHQFSQPLHILKSKAILLRTYFEQFVMDDSYYDLLMAQTYAFEKFVRRSEAISKTKKETYTNFILLTRTLGNARLQNTVDVVLYEKVKATKAVILKRWLLNKVEEALQK